MTHTKLLHWLRTAFKKGNEIDFSYHTESNLDNVLNLCSSSTTAHWLFITPAKYIFVFGWETFWINTSNILCGWVQLSTLVRFCLVYLNILYQNLQISWGTNVSWDMRSPLAELHMGKGVTSKTVYSPAWFTNTPNCYSGTYHRLI